MMEPTSINITGDATLLDVVSKWPTTETVFRRYDEKAGVCLCCNCLFDTIEAIAYRHNIDLAHLMRELQDAAAGHKTDDRDAARTRGNAPEI